jgi:DNA modification methylase
VTEQAPIRYLGDLTPDPANARRHTPRNVGTIVDALHEVGAARSIVIDEDGTILAGNATAEAAAEAGIERVQVVDADGDTLVAVRRTGLTPQQKQRLALYDNRAAELAEWDAERLSAFLAEDAAALEGLFHREEVDALLATLRPPAGADPGPQIDRAEELRAKWATAPDQLWEIPSATVPGRSHRLLCGDGTADRDVDRVMGGALAELVFTDPPYGVNVSGKGGDAVAGDLFFTAIPFAFDAIARALSPHGWCYVCGGSSNLILYARLFEKHFRQLVRVVVWDKGRTAVLRHNGYHSCYEFVYFGFREGGGDRWYGGRTSDDADDIWRIPLDADSDRYHPTQKPVALPARAIQNSCPPGEIVFDPFVGAAGTLVAAEQTGRSCYALEIDPAYVAVALERLAGMGLSPRLVD